MSKVILSFSISLDGYAAGPDVSMENAMGLGGERLHDWLFNGTSEPGDSVSPGAVVLGRRTFDLGLRHWNDTPYPAPSFVVTHRPEPRRQMQSAAFSFVTDGVASAVTQAKSAAGDRDVVVMGVDIAQQVLAAGLADEVQLQLVPVLLGGGTRLFEHLGPAEFDFARRRDAAGVSHIHLSVRN